MIETKSNNPAARLMQYKTFQQIAVYEIESLARQAGYIDGRRDATQTRLLVSGGPFTVDTWRRVADDPYLADGFEWVWNINSRDVTGGTGKPADFDAAYVMGWIGDNLPAWGSRDHVQIDLESEWFNHPDLYEITASKIHELRPNVSVGIYNALGIGYQTGAVFRGLDGLKEHPAVGWFAVRLYDPYREEETPGGPENERAVFDRFVDHSLDAYRAWTDKPLVAVVSARYSGNKQWQGQLMPDDELRGNLAAVARSGFENVEWFEGRDTGGPNELTPDRAVELARIILTEVRS